MYRTAATAPGVRYLGIGRDALGRQGAVIAVGSGEDQYRLIFNEDTGQLLGTSIGFGSSARRAGVGPWVQTIARTRLVAG